jgi:RNA polymerase sigma-70 factor, ECF subfamily
MSPVLSRRAAPERAFERLYRRHVGDVYRYTLAVLRNRDDAEDVTQTTFMNAYRAYQRGERPEQPKNWLIAIAHNVCRQRFRQAQRRPQETMLFDDAAELAVEEPEHEYSVDDIQRALGHLAFNQRAALVARELEGRSYAEIAQIMGVTVSAVETLIFRGRRALREQLEGSFTCAQAELALSKQSDGMLPRSERGPLRAHLRECKECATFARRQRATRGALKALGAVPLPSSLLGWFGGGGATVGAGVAAKAAAVVCAGVVVGGVGYEGAKHVRVGAPRAAATPRVVEVGHARTQAISERMVAPARQELLPLERVVARPAATQRPASKRNPKSRSNSKPHVKATVSAAHPARGNSAAAHAANAERKAAHEAAKAARQETKITPAATPKVHVPKPKKPKPLKPEKPAKPARAAKPIRALTPAASVGTTALPEPALRVHEPQGKAVGRASAPGQVDEALEASEPPGQADKPAHTKP